MSPNKVTREDKIREVLKIIHALGPIPRQKISAKLGTSFATVCSLVNDLERQGLCYLKDSGESSGGRPFQLVHLRADAKVGVVIDFTLPEIRIELADFVGQRIHSETFWVEHTAVFRDVVDLVKIKTNAILEQYGRDKEEVMGVLAVVPAIVDRQAGTTLCAAYPWLEASPLRRVLTDALDIQVWVENDANLGAMALSVREKLYHHLVFIYIGEGLGLGIISNGSILTGAFGFAGEVGHMPLGDPEVQCSCGDHGCLEAVLSIPALKRTTNDPSSFKRSATALSRLISSLINLFDPEVVFIGCELASIVEQMLPVVKEGMSRKVVMDNLRSPIVKVTTGLKDLFFEGATEQLFRYWLSEYRSETVPGSVAKKEAAH